MSAQSFQGVPLSKVAQLSTLNSQLFPQHRLTPLRSLLAALALVIVPTGWAAEAPTERAPVVIERGAGHRVMEWLTDLTDEAGQALVVTNRYTEVAAGLHYFATSPASLVPW